MGRKCWLKPLKKFDFLPDFEDPDLLLDLDLLPDLPPEQIFNNNYKINN